MEKLLAMSNLSSTPADISAGGWMDVVAAMTRNKKGKEEQRLAQAEKKNPQQQQQQKQKQKQKQAWFAPEFDGLNCFETLVSH